MRCVANRNKHNGLLRRDIIECPSLDCLLCHTRSYSSLKTKNWQFYNFVVTLDSVSRITTCQQWRLICQIEIFCFQWRSWLSRSRQLTHEVYKYVKFRKHPFILIILSRVKLSMTSIWILYKTPQSIISIRGRGLRNQFPSVDIFTDEVYPWHITLFKFDTCRGILAAGHQSNIKVICLIHLQKQGYFKDALKITTQGGLLLIWF